VAGHLAHLATPTYEAPHAADAASARDPLTHALTRHALLHVLGHATACAERARRWLLLIDIDGMKSINERHGQARGDAVLREAVLRLQCTLSAALGAASGHVARYDGDAVLVAIEGCGRHDAAHLAEALRHAIAAEPVAGIITTCSIGATEQRIGEPLDVALARGEQTLHLAKQFGRDRVEIAHTAPQHPKPAPVRYLDR